MKIKKIITIGLLISGLTWLNACSKPASATDTDNVASEAVSNIPEMQASEITQAMLNTEADDITEAPEISSAPEADQTVDSAELQTGTTSEGADEALPDVEVEGSTEDTTDEASDASTENPTGDGTQDSSEKPTELPTIIPTDIPTGFPEVTPTDIPSEDNTGISAQGFSVTPMPDDLPAPTPEVTSAPVKIVIPEGTASLTPTPEPEPTPVLTGDVRSFLNSIEKKYSSIPVICIYTDNGSEITSIKEYNRSSVYLVNCDQDNKIFGEAAGVRVRGNSSAFYGNVDMILKNQVPYRIKFDEKRNMLGLNSGAKCRNWVLIRAEWDVVKADLAFRLGRAFCRHGNYCSDGRLVLVYVNSRLKGIYELCEQNQVNKHRVNVNEPVENYGGTDIGYLLEIDNYCESPYFVVDYASRGVVTDINGVKRAFIPAEYSIKSDVYSDAQKKFIKKYVNNVFTILFDACVNSKYQTFDNNYDIVKADKKALKKKITGGQASCEAEAVAEEIMDLDSVVDMYLVYELYKDRDVGEGSFFMCVDFSRDSSCRRLRFCAPWDFEWSCEGKPDDGFYAGVFNTEQFAKTYEDRSNPWFILLMSQEWFYKRVQRRWQELRSERLPVDKGLREQYHEICLENPNADNASVLKAMKKKFGKFDTDNIVNICLLEEKNAISEVKSDINQVSGGISDSAYYHVSYIEKRIRWMDGMMNDEARRKIYSVH